MNGTDFDSYLATAIEEAKGLAQLMLAEGYDIRAAHVLNAILDFRKAYSPERQSELEQRAAERLERLRAV